MNARKISLTLCLALVVNFGFGQIIANIDFFSQVNGWNGTANLGNAFSNDTLNWLPVDAVDITCMVITPAVPVAGNPVPVLDPTNGDISVPSGTPAGTYTITYEICENANLNNCDQAVIVVVVDAPEIVANDDLYGPVNGITGSPIVGNAILENDIFNGAPVILSDVTASVLTPATPIGFNPVPEFNPSTGVVSVPAGTPAGTYTMVYELCENLNPANCDEATITVVVIGPQANPDIITISPNATASMNVYDNDLNVNPSDFNINISLSPLYGTASINQDGTLTYTNTIPFGCNGDSLIYQFCQISNPSNCFEAWVYIYPDIAPPTFDNCPADIIVNANAGLCGAQVLWTPITVNSPCFVYVTSSHNPGAFFSVGSTTVTTTAIDAFGNTTVCQFLVTVNDIEAPTVICPSDTSTCSDVILLPQIQAFDNCGPVTINEPWTSPVAGLISGGVWPIGVHTVTYEVADFAGNIASCSYTVEVLEVMPPEIICPNDTTIYALNTDSVFFSWQQPEVSSICGSVNTTFTSNPIGIFNNWYIPVGTNEIFYETTDNFGNTATCSFEISIELLTVATAITGLVYLDQNDNCSFDQSEIAINNTQVQLFTDQGVYVAQTYTSYTGEYQFIVPEGDYIVSTLPFSASQVCNNDIPVEVIENQIISQVNLGHQCDTPGFDIAVNSIVPVGWVFPGQTHNLRINTASIFSYSSGICSGTLPNNQISGELVVTIDGPVNYLSPYQNSMTPTSVSGNVITYQIDNYALVNSNTFRFNLQTQTTAQSGDQVCVNAVFTPAIPGDLNLGNNTLDFCYAALNSYDPNIKTVSPPGDVFVGYEDDLIYTIYFQNTGDAPAFNITLVDTLSSNLNLLTFEKMASSHDCTVDIMGNEMTIHFPDIMLPDSTSNPEGSIGFFQYKIKPLVGLVEGASIENTAHIFFDFNEAIVTNTTLTNFVVEDESSLEAFSNTQIRIFPNPNNGNFSVSFNAEFTGEATLQITDVSGKSHFNERIHVDANGFSWQGDLSPGVYFVRIVEAATGELYIGRVVVE